MICSIESIFFDTNNAFTIYNQTIVFHKDVYLKELDELISSKETLSDSFKKIINLIQDKDFFDRGIGNEYIKIKLMFQYNDGNILESEHKFYYTSNDELKFFIELAAKNLKLDKEFTVTFIEEDKFSPICFITPLSKELQYNEIQDKWQFFYDELHGLINKVLQFHLIKYGRTN